jgi:dihydrodipicolinate reductase
MFKNKQSEYIIGMRLMKCAVLIINNLGIGVNLLQHIISEADSIIGKTKDGS